jgi:hypothetical protein
MGIHIQALSGNLSRRNPARCKHRIGHKIYDAT